MAARLAQLLNDAPDAIEWIASLAWEAEQRGWVLSAADRRQENAWVFALDLFADNPVAFKRLPFVGFELPPPDGIEELSTFADLIV